jgi:hypothetical protein
MRRRPLIIAIGALVILVLLIVAITMAVGGRKLTLNAEPNIDTVTIDGTSTAFKQGMKVDYQKAITIEVAQNGYDAFKAQLDPKANDIKDYTIKLTKHTDTPVGSKGYDLLEAAKNNADDNGLLVNSKLNATITNSKSFANGYTFYAIGNDTGPAYVVVRNQDGTANIVLGPGTRFVNSDLLRMPSDVAAYLRSLGVGESNQ